MSILEIILVFFLVWWLVLFCVLPFGVSSQKEQGIGVDGSDPGAPARARILHKLLWTTLITTGLWLAIIVMIMFVF